MADSGDATDAAVAAVQQDHLIPRSTSVPQLPAPGGDGAAGWASVARAHSVAVFQRARSAEDAERSLAKIKALKARLLEVDAHFTRSLSACQTVIDACGEAIKVWFSGLRGASLERAIREVRDGVIFALEALPCRRSM
jgi:hypothetical protein